MQARITNEVPAELVCEFLEVVTHEILYLRKIYTPEIFERERLYGIVVHKSRHPELNLYVSDALLSLKEGIKLGKVRQVVILIYDAGGRLQEKFVTSVQAGEQLGLLDVAKVESAFRGCILKLQYVDACMKAIPEGCTFDIAAHLSELGAVPIDVWVEETSEESSGGSKQPNSIVPIKSVNLGSLLKLQLHAETHQER